MAQKVTRQYGSFRGVDFRGEDLVLSRSPDSVNMWKDYKQLESIRTRPAMSIKQSTGTVYGIFSYKGELLIHSGSKLYSGSTEILSGLRETRSNGFVYDETFYLMDGNELYNYTGGGAKAQIVEGYTPTTTIGRKPSGGGTTLEDVNMLTGVRKNSFVSDGTSKEYLLDRLDIDADYAVTVTVNGEPETGFTVDSTEGKVTFDVAPPLPLTGGQDNVVITFRKSTEGYRDAITKCTLLQVFDNRVFVSGNPNFPNTVFHCSLSDPTYFSDTDYYQDGLDRASIRGLVAGNNALWVFREPSEANTTVFYHTPTIDAEYGKIYPSVHSSVTTGCTAAAINFNDDIVFFSERGMEGISGDITTEQVVAHRSTLVDRKLTTEDGYGEMVLCEWEGYLIVFIGDKAYLADSRSAWNNEDHIEYEWFYWEMEKPVTAAAVIDGILHLGSEDGVYTLTEYDAPVESRWVTPKDRFNAPNMQKTTNKRGCVIEGTGSFSVYAKTDSSEYELVQSYTNITDYAVSRIRQKKFKDLQVMFYSDSRFSLESVMLECFIGGYIKR